MSATNTILLYRQGGMWVGEHFGPKAQEVRELFGTTVLPTPFSSIVSPGEVMETVQSLNPHAVVAVLDVQPDD